VRILIRRNTVYGGIGCDLVCAADKGVEIAADRNKVTKQQLNGKCLAVDRVYNSIGEVVLCAACVYGAATGT
jgi:hypothetical protein